VLTDLVRGFTFLYDKRNSDYKNKLNCSRGLHRYHRCCGIFFFFVLKSSLSHELFLDK
jgi:hypothetical protein